MSATIVFGVKIKTEKVFYTVTKYNENTGKPYNKKVHVGNVDFVVGSGQKFKLPEFWHEEHQDKLDYITDGFDFTIYGICIDYNTDNSEIPMVDWSEMKTKFKKNIEQTGWFTDSQIESLVNAAKPYIMV